MHRFRGFRLATFALAVPLPLFAQQTGITPIGTGDFVPGGFLHDAFVTDNSMIGTTDSVVGLQIQPNGSGHLSLNGRIASIWSDSDGFRTLPFIAIGPPGPQIPTAVAHSQARIGYTVPSSTDLPSERKTWLGSTFWSPPLPAPGDTSIGPTVTREITAVRSNGAFAAVGNISNHSGQSIRPFYYESGTGYIYHDDSSLSALDSSHAIDANVSLDIIVGADTYATARPGGVTRSAWVIGPTSGKAALDTSLPGTVETIPYAIATSATTIVGAHLSDRLTAVRWASTSSPMQALWQGGIANAISADGLVIGGSRIVGSAPTLSEIDHLRIIASSEAIRYTDGEGAQTIRQWLRSTGVAIVDPLDYNAVLSVDDDGDTLLVAAIDIDPSAAGAIDPMLGPVTGFRSALARAGAGLVLTDAELFQSFAGAFSASAGIRRLHSGVFQSAHKRHLLDRAIKPTGFYASTTGNAAHFDDRLDADQLLGEVSISHDLGIPNFRGGLSLGHSAFDQDLTLGGAADIDGSFFTAEAAWQPNAGSLTLSGLFLCGSWDADIRRHYRNLGIVESSLGSTDIENVALRLRGDFRLWQNEQWQITPRGSITWSHTSTDAYTETGGGFPATFSRQSSDSFEFQIGVDVDYELTDTISLRGIFDYSYLIDEGAALRGQLVGAMPFAFSSTDLSGGSVRVGTEAKIRVSDHQQLFIGLATNTGDHRSQLNGWISYGIQF